MEELDLFKSEKLSRAVESLAEAVIITDPGGTITYVNPAFVAITGYSAEEAIGQNPRILKSGQNPPETYKKMWDVLLQGKVWRGPVTNKRKDGSFYNAELTISPIWNDQGRILSYVAVQHEVTDILQAEEQARLRTEEYKVLHKVAQSLHKSSPLKEVLNEAIEAITRFDELKVEYKGGIFLADEENRVLRLFTTIGEFSDEFMEREQEVPYGDCLCGKAAASGEMLVSNSCFSDARHDRQFKDMTAHGHYIVPLKSREKLVGILFLYTDENPPWYERSQEILLSIGGLMSDAIEHRRVEEQIRHQNIQLAEANDKLKELNDLKNQFLGIASHDLRNPLYLIRSYSEILIDSDEIGPINEKQRKLLKTIFESSEHMKFLLNNLLDISRIESGKIELEKVKVDFNDLIRNRVELNGLLAKKKDIRLHFHPAADLPSLLLDKNSIIQVIDNLISNATKFSPRGKSVHVSTENLGDRVRCSIKDEGPGISEEDQKRLFGTFQTLSAKPTGGEKSTGLGLAIVKKIVNLHEGEVGVSSRLGEGATFFFTLPLK